MLRAIRRQITTDLQTLGPLSRRKRALSITPADRAAAVVPAVSALRESTWNAKGMWERLLIPVTVPQRQGGLCIRWPRCACCPLRQEVNAGHPGSTIWTWRAGMCRYRSGGTTRPAGTCDDDDGAARHHGYNGNHHHDYGGVPCRRPGGPGEPGHPDNPGGGFTRSPAASHTELEFRILESHRTHPAAIPAGAGAIADFSAANVTSAQ